MASWLSRLESLYHDYIDTVQELERNRKFGEGLFGMRSGPKDSPCHERFAEDVEKLLNDFGDTSPTSEDCAALLRYMFTVPEDWNDLKSVYWMLIAVQKFGIDLIGRLNPADAQALTELFIAKYPRRNRMPVQVQILKKLKQQAN
jgi:hypothetical protein